MSDQKSWPNLIPAHVARLRAYVPGKPMEEVERELGLTSIKLASNENPLGPSPQAVEAAMRVLKQSNRYPDAAGYYLRERLAERHQIDTTHIVLGNGSTELIQLLCQVYLGPGRTGLTSEGTFIVFPLSVQAAEAQLIEVPLRDYAYDLTAIADALNDSVRAVYLANPNNPTGTLFTADDFDRFLKRVPENVLVILDEAYSDYVQRPDYSRTIELVRAGRYLIALRTFSKAYGLAGLRIGYGIGHPEVISAVNKVRSPFNVSHVAQAAALAALDDREHIRRSVEVNRAGLAFLQAELSRLGFKVVPSAANFLYVETGRDPRQDYRSLLQMGVVVRPLDFMGMPAGLRVSVGTERDNRKVVDAFATVLAAPASALPNLSERG